MAKWQNARITRLTSLAIPYRPDTEMGEKSFPAPCGYVNAAPFPFALDPSGRQGEFRRTRHRTSRPGADIVRSSRGIDGEDSPLRANGFSAGCRLAAAENFAIGCQSKVATLGDHLAAAEHGFGQHDARRPARWS